jgi:ribonuclease G
VAISELLSEGQEILVQIAKEPIAKKGARITSHIALPGRFLVYMPTVEHLGVSRKIDSDTERSRLRKLIQKIHAEEDVPSGALLCAPPELARKKKTCAPTLVT